jgi:hypothetical protein
LVAADVAEDGDAGDAAGTLRAKDASPAAVYGAETAAALLTGLLVAPLVAIVDSAIFLNASGKRPMLGALGDGFGTLFKRPATFVKQPAFLWIWLVYGGTYVVANNVETWYRRDEKSTKQDGVMGKFVISSCANAGLSVIKDNAFAKLFANEAAGAKPRAVPPRSLAIFALRDAMTVGAAFTAPPLITAHLKEHVFPDTSPRVLGAAAQVFAPLGAQLFNTPLYLLGLDWYNRPAVTMAERASFIAREYTKTVAARWGRIFPAFGIGGITNTFARRTIGLID